MEKGVGSGGGGVVWRNDWIPETGVGKVVDEWKQHRIISIIWNVRQF